MIHRLNRLQAFVIFIIASFPIFPEFSQGALGEKGDSVRHDRTLLLGSEKVIPKEHFKVHEITSHGTQIREYVSEDDCVFAISWRGMSQPDLSILFGDYYKDFRRASRRQKSRRRGGVQVIRTKRLVVEKSGHMRDVRGKAYIPTLFPSGFSPLDIT